MGTRPVRILFAEDDLDQAHLVKFLLEAGGDYSVTLVQDGNRALELLEAREWDLLITDLNLPGAHGTRVVNAARSTRPELPIIATTGYTGPEYSQRAVELGADRALVKPLDRDELLEQVRILVQEGRPRRGRPDTEGATPAEPAPDPAPARSARAAARTAAAVMRGEREERQDGPDVGPEPLQVLAVSVHPGDAEAGCGGTLLRHIERGDRVVLLHLARRTPGESGDIEGRFARDAAQRLGARSFVGNVSIPPEELEEWAGLDELRRLAEGAVREVRPDVLYIPTSRHRSRAHRAVHGAATAAADADGCCLAYDAGAVTLSFAPDLVVPFEGGVLERKVEVLEAYEGHPVPHLDPAFVRASARYWGRFAGGVAAEAYEHLSGTVPFPDVRTERTLAAEAAPNRQEPR